MQSNHNVSKHYEFWVHNNANGEFISLRSLSVSKILRKMAMSLPTTGTDDYIRMANHRCNSVHDDNNFKVIATMILMVNITDMFVISRKLLNEKTTNKTMDY